MISKARFPRPRLTLRAIAVLVGAVGALAACVETESSGGGPEVAQAAAMSATFTSGCLNRQRSMRTALRAFDAGGFRYREPFSGSGNSGNSAESASVRIPSGVPIPARGDRDWDTRLLECELGLRGLFAGDVYDGVMRGLQSQGFRAVTALARPSGTGTAEVSGIYTRDGMRFRIVLGQYERGASSNVPGGDFRQRSGSTRTAVSIDSLSEPPGYRLR